MITFFLGEDRFVLDIMSVLQIVPYSGTTHVPTAPDFVEGIILLRNQVIPVIDLRARLYPELGLSESNGLILITDTSSGLIGLKVDEVRRIINVEVDAILPPPPLLTQGREGLVIGVVPQADEIFMLIDFEALLSDEERRVLHTADFTTELVPSL